MGNDTSGRSEGSLRDLADTDIMILRLLASGQPHAVVAREVGMSERTLRRRCRTIAETMGVSSTIEAIVAAVRHHLI